MPTLQLQEWMAVLLSRAEKLGHRELVLEQLTRFPGSCCQIAGFMEAGLKLNSIARQFDEHTQTILGLCGLPVSWFPVNEAALLPTVQRDVMDTWIESER